MAIRVLVIFGNIPLYGHERANIAVFTALKDAGVDALFATNIEWGGVYVTPYLDVLGLRWNPVTFPTLSGPNAEPPFSLRTLWRIAKANFEILRLIREHDPDYLYLANETYFITMLPALLLTARPVIYRVGDSPQQHRAVLRIFWRWILAHRVTNFVCVSEFIASRVKRAGVPESKVRVVYSHPSQRIEVGDASAATERRTEDEIVVTYVGQISADKGVDVLIEAALDLCSERGDLRFVIAGDYAWENPFAASLRKRVDDAEMSGRITFLGMIESIDQLLRSTDIHVCPSVWAEPLANVVVEAKAAGVPSVIFPVGGLPEIVSHLVEGYVCKTPTAAGLKEAIKYLADNSDARRRLGQNAREDFSARFGLERFRREWLAVLSTE